jgi:hypothetical protein
VEYLKGMFLGLTIFFGKRYEPTTQVSYFGPDFDVFCLVDMSVFEVRSCAQ